MGKNVEIVSSYKGKIQTLFEYSEPSEPPDRNNYIPITCSIVDVVVGVLLLRGEDAMNPDGGVIVSESSLLYSDSSDDDSESRIIDNRFFLFFSRTGDSEGDDICSGI